jgi:aryl-alcohol dehydrogenase-like predicted oxidoreductase
VRPVLEQSALPVGELVDERRVHVAEAGVEHEQVGARDGGRGVELQAPERLGHLPYRGDLGAAAGQRAGQPLGDDGEAPGGADWDAESGHAPSRLGARPIGHPRAMEHRQLGRSGLRISTLTLGTMTFGGAGRFADVGDTDVEGARRQIDLCLDAGVTLIDTANVYSTGRSEEIIGEALDGGRRDRVMLATKARMPMGDGPNDAGLSRHHLIAECEASLRRLGADHIDLYQVHEWDGQTPLEETLEALDTLLKAGKIRYVGCSNYAGWQLMKALGTSERHGYERFVSQQIYYSLQARDAEYELVPVSLDQGLGILVWSPLAGGLLSGKYRRGVQAPEGSRQLTEWNEPPVRDQEGLYDVVEALVEIGEAHDASAAQVALAWLLGRPGVTSLVVGARTEEQLADNLRAAELALTAEEHARLEELSRPPLIYPHWHQAKTASDRLGPADVPLLGPALT